MSSQNSVKACVNVNELREECRVALVRADVAVDQRSETEHSPASVDTTTSCTRGGDEKPPPGPACSKARKGPRARDGSTSSAPSRTSGASADVAAQRKNSREAAREANRFAVLAEREQEAPIYIDSEESEEEPEHMVKGKTPLKRRIVKEEEDEEPPQERKRGRPQTTALHLGRAQAIERANRAGRREMTELEEQKILRSLSASEVLSNVDRAVEDMREELEHAPTEDVAQQVRQSMAQVLRIAKSSKNLKGPAVKVLKTAAVVGSASAEVLRLRADREVSESNALGEVRALRRELKLVKREARTAKEEAARANAVAEKLREELKDVKKSGKSRDRKSVV